MRTVIRWIEQFAKWPYLVGAFLLVVGSNLLILSQVTRFEEATGGMSLLELPTLIPQNLYAIAQGYTPAGMQIYQSIIQPLDIVFPLTVGLFFALVLAALTTRLFPVDSRRRYLPLLGPLATLGDWLENLGVFFILRTVNDPIPALALLTKAFIVAKLIVGLLAIFSILILFAMWVSQRLRGPRQVESR